MFKKTLYALLGAAILVAAVAPAQAQEWRLVNPSGVVELKAVEPAPRLDTLEGKTIVLHWNGKHNGNIALDRVAELLAEKVPSAKVIKAYEDPSLKFTVAISSALTVNTIADALVALKPDLVISSTAD